MTDHTELVQRLNSFRGDHLGDGISPNVRRSELVSALESQAQEIEPLTDVEVDLLWRRAYADHRGTTMSFDWFEAGVRALEATIRAKGKL